VAVPGVSPRIAEAVQAHLSAAKDTKDTGVNDTAASPPSGS
jgi:hypothetical protein